MTTVLTPASTSTATRRRRPGLGTALRWELVKLLAQARVRYSVLAAVVLPPLVVLVLKGQQRPPKDTLFGRFIHHSGYALPLLLLGFAAQWLFPLLCSVVSGELFAGEDSAGTWKTLLTRSVSRTQVFWAKSLLALAYTVVVTVVLATSTILASVTLVGAQPLIGLSGQTIPSSSAAPLVVASWACMLPPLVAFTALAVLLSVLTRNATAAVVTPVVLGFVLTLVGSLGGLDLVRRGLPTTGFEAWHGLLTEHRFYEPLFTSTVVSAVWTVLCLGTALTVLRRRDITGG